MDMDILFYLTTVHAVSPTHLSPNLNQTKDKSIIFGYSPFTTRLQQKLSRWHRLINNFHQFFWTVTLGLTKYSTILLLWLFITAAEIGFNERASINVQTPNLFLKTQQRHENPPPPDHAFHVAHMGF